MEYNFHTIQKEFEDVICKMAAILSRPRWGNDAFYLTARSAVVSCHYNDVIMGAMDHQPHDCLLNRLFRRRSNKTSKLRVTGLCAENSPVTGEFPHKWPVTQKMVQFDDVIMVARWASSMFTLPANPEVCFVCYIGKENSWTCTYMCTKLWPFCKSQTSSN